VNQKLRLIVLASAVTTALLTFQSPLAVGADNAAEWKVGLARVKITPEQPVFLAGYASRNHPYEKVETDLFAKALALEDGHGQRAVIVTTDLIGLSAAVAEPVCERIRAKSGLERAQVLLNSSHIHTGPEVSLNPKPHDGMAAGDAERTVAYTRQLQDKLVGLVAEALAHMEPVRLSWGTGVVHFVMNRREFTPNGVILGVNARGLADRSVPVLRVDGADGKLRAVLFGTACHNTTLTEKHYEVCGDYAGFAQTAIEERYPGAQALFMIGCAGDANPYPRGTMALSREHGAALAKEVGRVLDTKLRPIHGSLRVAFDRAALPLQTPPSRSELEKRATRRGDIQAWVAKQMLTILDRGDNLPVDYTCPFAAWQLGDLTLVGLPGEVVVDYVSLLEKALGPNRLWLAAYCNDVFGYLPSARVLAEGGYETRGLYSGGIGLFAPQAQDVVVATVRNLAKQAGRP
jgi:neutral ceramidase